MNPRDRRFLEEADGYLELELPVQALAALDRISNSEHGSFDWNQMRANALIALQRYPEALANLMAARDANPNSVPTYLSMGWCYKRLNQITRAIEVLKTAEKLCRRGHFADLHALVMYNLSCYFSLARRKGDMFHWLERALAADSKYRKNLIEETDFDHYRTDPEFVAFLTTGVQSGH